MKKKHLFIKTFLLLLLLVSIGYSQDTVTSSKITSVKLYQNQAKIIRKAKISLKRGNNKVIISELPKLLYNWSVKGKLPSNFKGKILSLEVEKKALIQKRQKKILKIEKKIDGLRKNDLILVDELKNIRSQEKFLNSILNFTNQTVAKELATRIPQIKVWDNTLNYVSSKKRRLLKAKRTIESRRERIGKEIQKWEFELSQIAGISYFRNYQSLNKIIIQNRANIGIQQFANSNEAYGKRYRLLKKPSSKVNIEKRIIANIFSDRDRDIVFHISYVIPNTYWQMKYDIRASNKDQLIKMVIYANIYQNTEEDWKNIDLSLSTGAPINSITRPTIYSWHLNERVSYGSRRKYAKKLDSYSFNGNIQKQKSYRNDGKAPSYRNKISKKGPYINITLPLKQTIASSNKYQKKYIKDYKLQGYGKIKFYYELYPSKTRNGYLMVDADNTTSLPWLKGQAQIFLENEFMGKVTIPFTPKGKKETFVLGIEPNITSSKILLKKYEDTSGVFGGNRRITYKYKIKLENQLSKKKEVMVIDHIPVSLNKKITVSLENLSHPFYTNTKIIKSSDYLRGIRKWKIFLAPHEKKDITYEVKIAFDKDIKVSGLRN